MKIYSKRILSFFIAMIMLFITSFIHILPVNAASTSGVKGDIKWDLINGVLTISSNTGKVVGIPASEQLGFPKTEVNKIVIDSTINSIGNGPLTRCDNVKSIVIPDSVVTIEPKSFYMKPDFSTDAYMCNEVEIISNNPITKSYNWLDDNINPDKNAELYTVSFKAGDTATLINDSVQDYYDGEFFGFKTYRVPKGFKVGLIPLADTLTSYFNLERVDKVVNGEVKESIMMNDIERIYEEFAFKNKQTIEADTVFTFYCKGIKQENIRVSYLNKNTDKELLPMKNISMNWFDKGPIYAPEIKGYTVDNPTEEIWWNGYVYGTPGHSGIHMNFEQGTDLPSGEKLSNWRYALAFFYIPNQYEYTVQYIDVDTGKPLLPEKTGQAAFDSTVEEIAPDIAGYKVDMAKKSLVMKENNNVIVFNYSSNDYPYSVQYVDDEGHKLLEDKIGSSKLNSLVTETAPDIIGYTVDEASKSITIAEENNLIIFTYTPNIYDYTVKYINADTGESLLSDRTGQAAYGSTVEEIAYDIRGYQVDEQNKSITMTENENLIIFKYKANQYDYSVHYVDEEGKPLLPEKTGQAAFDSTIEETAPDIVGYKVDVAKKSTIITDGENKIYFIYSPQKYDYTVKYVDADTGKELLPDKIKQAVFNSTVEEIAPDISGYVPDESKKSIVIKEKENLIVFQYKEKLTYRVQYLDLKDNELIPEKTVTIDTEKNVTEKAVSIFGYTVNKSEQSLDVQYGKDNLITFIYQEEEKIEDTGKGYFSDYELVTKTTCINGIILDSKIENSNNILNITIGNKKQVPSKITASLDILLPSGTPIDTFDIYNTLDVEVDENGEVIMPYGKGHDDSYVYPLTYTVSHTKDNDIIHVSIAEDKAIEGNKFSKSFIFVDTSETLTNIDVRVNAEVTSTVNGGGFSNQLEDNIINLKPYHYQKTAPIVHNGMYTYFENTDEGTITISGFSEEYKQKLENGQAEGEILIPNVYEGKTVKAVQASAFENENNILSVTVDDNIKIIGNKAFYNCSNLSGIVIGTGVTNIGRNAFYIEKKIPTYLILQNDVSREYDWIGDNRKEKIKE